MWHDENPERGPRCGGHCTAMLWKSATKLGCGMGPRNLVVCRYGGKSLRDGTPNFGGRASYEANVGFPDDSKKDACKKKFPQSKAGPLTKRTLAFQTTARRMRARRSSPSQRQGLLRSERWLSRRQQEGCVQEEVPPVKGRASYEANVGFPDDSKKDACKKKFP